MALTGNEPINAANLRELSESGRLGGTVLFERETPVWEKIDYTQYTNIAECDLSQSVYDFDHIVVVCLANSSSSSVGSWYDFYAGHIEVPTGSIGFTKSFETFSDGSLSVTTHGPVHGYNNGYGDLDFNFSNGGRHLSLRGVGIFKVIGYK